MCEGKVAEGEAQVYRAKLDEDRVSSFSWEEETAV